MERLQKLSSNTGTLNPTSAIYKHCSVCKWQQFHNLSTVLADFLSRAQLFNQTYHIVST